MFRALSELDLCKDPEDKFQVEATKNIMSTISSDDDLFTLSMVHEHLSSLSVSMVREERRLELRPEFQLKI